MITLLCSLSPINYAEMSDLQQQLSRVSVQIAGLLLSVYVRISLASEVSLKD